MNRSISINPKLIIFGIPFGLFAILIFFLKSSLFTGSDMLAFAVSADLVLTIPVIYFLLIRKRNIPNTTVIPVMVVGLIIGSYFMPKDDQFYLNLFKTYALPLVEISVLTFIIVKVHSAVKKYKGLRTEARDFFTTLKDTCYEILPKKLVLPFVTEIAVFYYGFIHWKSRKLAENEFSYHKNSGTPALFGVMILIIGVETFALHILISGWSDTAAWIVSGLSIYTAIQVLGFAKSLSRRPVVISRDKLALRYGILNEVEIPLKDICKIELSGKPVEEDKLTRTLSPLGPLESHNVIIHLNNENILTGLYGIKKNFKTLAFHIDNDVAFKAAIETALKQNN